MRAVSGSTCVAPRTALASLLALFSIGAVSARAQTSDVPDLANVRVQIGPLYLNPTIALTNLGVDDNVFNDPASNAPKKDVTLTLTPKSDLWLHAGPTWVVGGIREDLNWYQQYSSERSANTTFTLGWRVPLTRLAFKLNSAYTNSRERPGFEIDARAQHTAFRYDGAIEFQTLSRTFLGVTALRERTNFDDNAAFRGANLHDELNRVSTQYGVTVREQLTTLTSVTFSGIRARDRFEFSPLRNADYTNALVSAEFGPTALINGSASVGYTNFQPIESGLPAFRGLIAAVNLSYTLLEATKFVGTVGRGVQYSYDVNQPYYVQTGFTVSIAQQIFGPFDLVGRVGRQSLDYRDRTGAALTTPDRSDHVSTYGGGVGYYFGKSLRLGFNVDNTKRTSPLQDRTYQGLRYGTALTYGG